MSKDYIPRAITAFTEYIKSAYLKAVINSVAYNLDSDALSAVKPAYDLYIELEKRASNPDTATIGARRARDEARKQLEALWRAFINAHIRYNPLVSVADLAVFRIRKRDGVRTPAGIPESVPYISVRRMGQFQYEIRVFDNISGKPKRPLHAAGSYLYIAVTDMEKTPEHADDFRIQSFSSNASHILQFPRAHFGKQAHIYAAFSNLHGKEGPGGPVEVLVIY
jgi:hypothetical protein